MVFIEKEVPMHYLFVFLLAFAAPLAAAPKLIIGIAGGTGSGKSSMAEELLKNFEGQVSIISQDNYYKDLTHLIEEDRAKQNFDHPDSIDFNLMYSHLLLLRNNEPIDMPVYDFCHHTRTGEIITVVPTDIIIVEGILLFAEPKVRDFLDFKIFVDADDDVRLLRRIDRDMKDRGRCFESIHHQYLTTVKPMHDAFVEPSKRYADVIIPTHDRNSNGMALIVSSLKSIAP